MVAAQFSELNRLVETRGEPSSSVLCFPHPVTSLLPCWFGQSLKALTCRGPMCEDHKFILSGVMSPLSQSQDPSSACVGSHLLSVLLQPPGLLPLAGFLPLRPVLAVTLDDSVAHRNSGGIAVFDITAAHSKPGPRTLHTQHPQLV